MDGIVTCWQHAMATLPEEDGGAPPAPSHPPPPRQTQADIEAGHPGMDALPEEDEKEGVGALLGGHGGGGFAALLGHGDAAVSPGRNDASVDELRWTEQTGEVTSSNHVLKCFAVISAILKVALTMLKNVLVQNCSVDRYRANMAHTKQSMPDSGLGLQTKVPRIVESTALCSPSDARHRIDGFCPSTGARGMTTHFEIHKLALKTITLRGHQMPSPQTIDKVQGYLAHNKPPPPRTTIRPEAQSCCRVLGGGAFS